MNDIKQVTRTINITAYTINGEPCCAKNFVTNAVCEFYRTKHFGCSEVCVFDISKQLQRRENGVGTLIPNKECCIVWGDLSE
jgi:hypothetical protein